jgi:hypothetical protein
MPWSRVLALQERADAILSDRTTHEADHQESEDESHRNIEDGAAKHFALPFLFPRKTSRCSAQTLQHQRYLIKPLTQRANYRRVIKWACSRQAARYMVMNLKLCRRSQHENPGRQLLPNEF